MSYRTVRSHDAGYPDMLREIPDPPPRLWVEGRTFEPEPMVAVVGTRRPTRYGVETARAISSMLARNGITIVSGMARGIDAAAHRGALDAGGKTVAVLGCGIDICYPRAHWNLKEEIARGGTVITEFEPGSPPLPHHFPIRNRIIAGMSMGVLIVEGKPRGGAMITSRLALEYGRDVFAIPGPVGSPQSQGPHFLIRDGARLVTSGHDVLCDLGLPLEEDSSAEFDSDEARILRQLGGEPKLIDVLSRETKMPASTVARVLAILELKSAVIRHPGGRFTRSSTLFDKG